MEKVNQKRHFIFLHVVCIFTLLLSPFQVVATICVDCGSPSGCNNVCVSDDELTNYEELEEYEEIYRDFEEQIEIDEANDAQAQGFFLKGWCKKLKRWFKKRIVSLLKKTIDLKKCKNPDYCAYTVAKFKRKIDRVYNTGNIEKILAEFDKYAPKDNRIDFIDNFKDRVRYYHRNKRASPETKIALGDSHDKKHNPLEEYPVRAVLGGLEIACGSLIYFLPIPGCTRLGIALVCHGVNNIYEGYTQRWEEEKAHTDHSK